MAAPLETNIDATYADSGTDPSQKIHQQYHDQERGILNGVSTNVQTASYTLALSDAVNTVVEMNVATANNLTIPPNSSVAIPVGSIIEVGQYGAGQTTLVAGSGVTIRSEGAKLKITGQYGAATLRKRATDEWWASGSLTT